jgi:ribonuclease HI
MPERQRYTRPVLIKGFVVAYDLAAAAVAMYIGIGLRYALERGAREVRVFSDSELLVRQLGGRYRVKNPGLLPLFREAQSLLARFESARVTHVPREENREADALANKAVDLKSSNV